MNNADPMKIFPKRSNVETTNDEQSGNNPSIDISPPKELVMRDMGIKRPWKDELIDA